MVTGIPTFGHAASSTETPHHTALPKGASVKALVESSGLTSIPSEYSYSTINPGESAGLEPAEDTLPIIDFSLLTSGDPHLRSKVIRDLDKACKDWGFFMLVNHGVSESLMKAVLDACGEFFNLPMEEKAQFMDKDVWKPIRFGTSIDGGIKQYFCWRDYIKLFVHPHFHSLDQPQGFSEVLQEYYKSTREVVRELLKGISEGLGFDECYIDKAMDFESSFQIFAANLYPPCSQAERAMGIPAHTDHGLLTLLIENEIGGLQIEHDGKWFNVNSIPNSFLVNTADQLEILSNGKYKSIMHRAVVNNKATRISIAVPHGPSLDTVVSPAPELVESNPALYMPMTYKDYVDRLLTGKPSMEHVRLPVA